MTSISHSTASGFAAVVMENAYVRAVVLPQLGGRIWELWDKARAVQWIWHRPQTKLERHAPGADYDSVWAGGWEELFPNDAAGEFEGRVLPDHGEWWASAWSVEAVDERDGLLTLTTQLHSRRVRCTKQIRLRADESALTVSYTIESEEDEAFHFLFKQHLPIAIEPQCLLEVAGATVVPVSAEFSKILRGPEELGWPGCPELGIDLSVVPPHDSGLQEFVYLRDLSAGECAVLNPRLSSRICMTWDTSEMPFLWLFMTYGGWRGLYTLVLEPCTNMPKDLNTAKQLGQARLLLPRGSFTTSVRVELTGLTP